MNRIIAIAAIIVALSASGCAAATEPEGAASPPAASGDASPSMSTGGPSATATEPQGKDDESPEPSASAASSAAAASRAHLAVATLGGDTFDAAATEGQPVILWFWAPWCTVCRAEAPDVNEVVAELAAAGSPVTLLGVPGRGGVPEMEDFVADTGTGGLTHLVDTEGVLWREYGVVYQPAFALLSPDGEVEVINGALGADGLREAAARLTGG